MSVVARIARLVMTDRRRRGLWTTATLALGAFLIVLTLLAWRLHSGEDPALAAGQASPEAVKHVIVRRVIRRTVVTRVVPAPAPRSAVPSVSGPAPSGPTSSPPRRPRPSRPHPRRYSRRRHPRL